MLKYINEKPIESGLYLWKDTENYEKLFHVLDSIKIKNDSIYVNFELDIDQFKYIKIAEVADRRWCKVT